MGILIVYCPFDSLSLADLKLYAAAFDNESYFDKNDVKR